jgi:glycosyltransferase involved in cell wall biosynthesis
MTGTPSPELSVIIPVWNGDRYLAETIDSVLGQDDAPTLEVIVVDDGSEDDSAAVAARYPPPVRCIRMRHAGLAAARNTGVAAAQGTFLLHLDADDLVVPGSIALRMRAFAGPSDVDVVVGRMQSFVSPDLDPEVAARYRPPSEPQRGGLAGTTIVTASFACRVGPLDDGLTSSSDLDWMLRAEELGARVVEVPEVVQLRRIHGRNQTLTYRDLDADRLRVVKAALARRSATGEPQAS